METDIIYKRDLIKIKKPKQQKNNLKTENQIDRGDAIMQDDELITTNDMQAKFTECSRHFETEKQINIDEEENVLTKASTYFRNKKIGCKELSKENRLSILRIIFWNWARIMIRKRQININYNEKSW